MDSARPFDRRSGRYTLSDDIAVSAGDVVSDGTLPPAVADRLDAWMTRVVAMKTDQHSETAGAARLRYERPLAFENSMATQSKCLHLV
jgi:hypothetical protein